MAETKDYSSTAANNTTAPPDGAPEGMLANTVNNTMRQMMANQKGSSLFTVDSLADMKALDVNKMTTGNSFFLKGLTTNGVGGGPWHYDSSSSAGTDDVDVVQPTVGAGRFLRDEGKFLALENTPIGQTTTAAGAFTTLGNTSTQTSNVASGNNVVYTKSNARPLAKFEGATLDTSLGIDGSDNFVVLRNDGSTANITVVNATGDTTYAGTVLKNGTHPAWSTSIASTISNVTGNATAYTVVYDTELYDQGGNLSGSTVTFPVTGKYVMFVIMRVSGIVAATSLDLRMITSNRDYQISFLAPTGIDISGDLNLVGAFEVDADASDTGTIRITGSGEAGDILDLTGSPTIINGWSGYLAA